VTEINISLEENIYFFGLKFFEVSRGGVGGGGVVFFPCGEGGAGPIGGGGLVGVWFGFFGGFVGWWGVCFWLVVWFFFVLGGGGRVGLLGGFWLGVVTSQVRLKH